MPGHPKGHVRTLAEDDLEQLFALRQVSYLDRSDFSDPAVRARHVARLPYSSGHFVGGELTSAAVCFPFGMLLAGRRLQVGGLAGVLSAPQFRRRGYVRDLLAALLQQQAEAGVGWMLEYPFDPRFYARYGFATVPTGSEVTVPADRLFRGAAPDAVHFTGDPETDLAPLYDHWAAGYNLTLLRDDHARPGWSRILGGDRFCYLLDGAYAVMELTATGDVQTLVVHDYAFASAAGRDQLFRLIGSFYGQAEHISLHLPADEPLAFDLQRYHTNELPALQARIVDLRAALEPLTSSLETTLTVHVEDAFCPWNDGTFRLELGPSGTSVTRTDAAPTVTLEQSTLTRLVTGAVSAAAALRSGVAEGEWAGLEAITALSGGRIPFMPGSDYF